MTLAQRAISEGRPGPRSSTSGLLHLQRVNLNLVLVQQGHQESLAFAIVVICAGERMFSTVTDACLVVFTAIWRDRLFTPEILPSSFRTATPNDCYMRKRCGVRDAACPGNGKLSIPRSRAVRTCRGGELALAIA